MVLLLDPGDEVIISEPTFGVYRALIAVHGGTSVDVPLTGTFELDVNGILAAVTPRTKLIIVCNPNNPTGNTFDPAAVERIVAEAPCLVGIDEAYAEFAGISHLPLMDRYPNVCCLRTLSKFAGLAGMRVGYGVFPKPLMPYLWAVTPAFCNISLASSVAAIASLEDLDYLNGIIARLNADRDAIADNLREIPGVEPLPTATNFILMRLPVADATPVIKDLASRGIFVRNFPNPALGIADHLRVSIGTAEENEIFLNELDSALQRVRGAA
jgi:histidinol-phosphate aminotransferase